MRTKRDTLERGFSLVEMLLYLGILSIISSALVLTGNALMRNYIRIAATEDVMESGSVALERMTREVRFAGAIDLAHSTLNSNPGVLTLLTFDASGSPTTVAFSLSGGRLMMTLGTNAPTPLTKTGITVTNLQFTRAVSAQTEGVGIALTLERISNAGTTTKQFETFVVEDRS